MGLFGKKNNEELVEKTFKVKGLMCSHCEMTVKSKLLGVEGIREASASAPLGKVSVMVTPEVTDQMIKDTITAAGYSVVEQ